MKTDQVHIAHHTDDFADGRFARFNRTVHNDSFPDRIFAGKKLLRKGLRHNRDCGCTFIVPLGEPATFAQRNPHGFEVISCDSIKLCPRLLTLRHWMSVEVESETDFTAAERKPPCRRN